MNMNLWSNNFHHLSMIPPECHVHVCRSVHAVRSFTHRLPALRKLDLVMRLILRLRLPGKARLGSELESGTGHFSLCNFDTRKIRKGIFAATRRTYRVRHRTRPDSALLLSGY